MSAQQPTSPSPTSFSYPHRMLMIVAFLVFTPYMLIILSVLQHPQSSNLYSMPQLSVEVVCWTSLRASPFIAEMVIRYAIMHAASLQYIWQREAYCAP